MTVSADVLTRFKTLEPNQLLIVYLKDSKLRKICHEFFCEAPKISLRLTSLGESEIVGGEDIRYYKVYGQRRPPCDCCFWHDVKAQQTPKLTCQTKRKNAMCIGSYVTARRYSKTLPLFFEKCVLDDDIYYVVVSAPNKKNLSNRRLANFIDDLLCSSPEFHGIHLD